MPNQASAQPPMILQLAMLLELCLYSDVGHDNDLWCGHSLTQQLVEWALFDTVTCDIDTLSHSDL